MKYKYKSIYTYWAYMFKSVLHWGMQPKNSKWMKLVWEMKVKRKNVVLSLTEYKVKFKSKYFHKCYKKCLIWNITCMNGLCGSLKIETWIF